MVRQFHDDMQAHVMAPALISMMFPAMLTDAFQNCGVSFPINNLFDGKLFNLRRLQAKSKVQTDALYVDKLLYAECQNRNKGLWIACHKHLADNFDLTISAKMT